MHVTVCVCTRNRATSIGGTILSLLALRYDDFDVVIVDQSVGDDTEMVARSAINEDTRFTYVHSDTVGASTARNVALGLTTGSVVAFTDDDCLVSADWLTQITRTFHDDPDVGCVCGEVRTARKDPKQGFIPDHIVRRARRISSPWLKWQESGILANMAFRREALRRVGPFDEVLGAGGELYACEDGDIVYRILRAGFSVIVTKDAWVTHRGLRTWIEGSAMMRRTGLGVGAAYMKHLRCGDMAVLPTLLVEWLRCVRWPRLLLGKPYSGAGRFLYYAAGMWKSFEYQIDRTHRTYIRQPAAQTVLAAPEAASTSAS